ncbi:hypothetical protein GA0070616_4017 [Micromonospora nigra]|uniref:Uncharacterized protein n=1 Tax=Micromonospora nigra TaxID=145857 RepID=A0A1C6SKV1_9ACTN|nr:hypothetical protein GA0070616_4017 [Micromonospora nigra]
MSVEPAVLTVSAVPAVLTVSAVPAVLTVSAVPVATSRPVGAPEGPVGGRPAHRTGAGGCGRAGAPAGAAGYPSGGRTSRPAAPVPAGTLTNGMFACLTP